MNTVADITPCNTYRYSLIKQWDEDKSLLGWILFHPGMSQDPEFDEKLSLCIGIASRLGYGGVAIAALYPLRAHHPSDLYNAKDPIGPDPAKADNAILDLWTVCKTVVAAWGVIGTHRDRDDEVKNLIRARGLECFCFGTNIRSDPLDPKYVGAGAALEVFVEGRAK